MKENIAASRTELLNAYIYVYSPLIVFLWFCFALPVGIAPYSDGIFSKYGILTGFAEGLFPAVAVGLLVGIPWFFMKNKSGKTISAILWAIVLVLGWIAVVVEYFCGFGLHCRFNEAVLQLILQSDDSESSEFLNYAMGLSATWKAVAASLVPLTAALATLFLRQTMFAKSYFMKSAVVLTLVSAGVFLWAHRPVLHENYESKRQSFMISPFQIMMSMRPLSDNSELIARIATANESVDVEAVDSEAPKIVVIIGESDNKSHSSLYGYRLATASALEALRDSCAADSNGCLIVFEDAVTGDCTTNLVMKRLLSTNDSSRDWADRPLLPAVLKSSGYNVGYYDNQSTPETCEVVDYSSVFFLNSSETAAQCFSERNDRRFDFDSDFVAHYLSKALAIEGPSVVFFHLMGQHIQASKRYKPEEGIFIAGDYETLSDYSEKERLDIMHYDNATYATANAVANIMRSVAGSDAIVIYLSDHSEEIYDYRHQYGRTQEDMTPKRARTLFEVPMYVFMTKEYIERHPAEANNLKAHSQSRIFTYDLPDLVLDLAGVNGPMLDRSRSIASERYDAGRPRMIHYSTYDYDSLVCRP